MLSVGTAFVGRDWKLSCVLWKLTVLCGQLDRIRRKYEYIWKSRVLVNSYIPRSTNSTGNRDFLVLYREVVSLRILYLDIETAPSNGWFWGLFKQNISIDNINEAGYTLCWSARWEGDKEILFSSVHGDGEKVMVDRIHALLSEADAVIHYNGTNFDIPILNSEFFRRKMDPPTPYQQIDLLRTVRSRFRLVSNKLDWVARELGIGNKVHHKGMTLWHGCMAGVDKDWKVMEKYNKQDVNLLVKLYKLLLPWIQNHPNRGLYSDVIDKMGNPVTVCPNCGSIHLVRNGMEHLATQSYQRYKCADCGTPLRGRTTVLPIEKRRAIITTSKL